MIGKILLATKGKPCTCPTGKLCPACKNKKGVRVIPRVIVEGSRDLPVPVKITTYKETSPAVHLLQNKKYTPYQKPALTESANRGTKICQWYRKRKALRALRRYTKLEKQRQEYLRRDKERRDREAQLLELLKQREKEIRHAEQKLLIEPKKSSVKVLRTQEEFVGKKSKKHKRKKTDAKHTAAKSLTQSKRGTKICQWYRRQKASRAVRRFTKLEKKRQEQLRRDEARREREAEFIEQLKQREREVRHAEERLLKEPKESPIEEFHTEEEFVTKYGKKHKSKKTTEAKQYTERHYKSTKQPKRGTKICQWYRKQKATRELRKLTKLENKRQQQLRREESRREKEEARRNREAELVEQLKQKEREIRYAEERLLKEPKESPIEVFEEEKVVSKKKKKEKRKRKKIKEEPPCSTECRYTSEKSIKHPKDTFHERLVNFCYRICCQCCCCMTAILVIGFIWIFVF